MLFKLSLHEHALASDCSKEAQSNFQCTWKIYVEVCLELSCNQRLAMQMPQTRTLNLVTGEGEQHMLNFTTRTRSSNETF
eukprot:1486105-Amphidinium_carterae.6